VISGRTKHRLFIAYALYIDMAFDVRRLHRLFAHTTVKMRATRMSCACYVLPRHILSPPSLRHFVTQGLLPSVVVLGYGFFLPVCGFVRTFD